MRPQRFQAEREPVAQDARLQRQGGPRSAGPAVDFEAARGPAPEGRPLAIEDDRLAQAGGRDVRLRRGADDARLGHQEHAVDGQGEPVPADDRQPGRRADRAGLAELELDGRAEPDHVAVAERGRLDRLAVDERRLVGAEDVAVAVADQGGVVPREVAHQRDVGVAVGAGAAEDDLVVQADEIAADGIDPEEEPAVRPGLTGAGQGARRGGAGPARRFGPAALIQAIGAASRARSRTTDGSDSVGLGSRTGAAWGTRVPRLGQAADGPIAAICCQARVRAWRAAGCSGTVSRTASAAARISGHRPAARAA